MKSPYCAWRRMKISIAMSFGAFSGETLLLIWSACRMKVFRAPTTPLFWDGRPKPVVCF